jgi:predicted DCC family thiol-disulfide oxidoreductase YuxK
MTEMPEIQSTWVFYDGNCRFCLNALDRVRPLLARCHIRHAPLQTDWVRARLGLNEEILLDEMKVLDRDGNVYGGADALIALAKMFWWSWPLFLAAQVPGVKPILRFAIRNLQPNVIASTEAALCRIRKKPFQFTFGSRPLCCRCSPCPLQISCQPGVLCGFWPSQCLRATKD